MEIAERYDESKLIKIPLRRRIKGHGFVNIHTIDEFLNQFRDVDGSFKDLEVGDFFIVDMFDKLRIIRIAGIDCIPKFGDHHIVCIPNEPLFKAKMNSAMTTGISNTNGSQLECYVGSDMFNCVIPRIDEELSKVFGSHIREHYKYLTAEIGKDGIRHKFIKKSIKSSLLSLVEIFGEFLYYGTTCDTHSSYFQLPIFLTREFSMNMANIWLRDIGNKYYFALLNENYEPDFHGANNKYNVLPYWVLS